MNRIKVLHIVYSLTAGGAERIVVNYATKFNSDNFNVQICALKSGGFFENILKQYRTTYVVLNKSKYIDFFALYKLIKFIRKESIDIIHMHGFPANYYGTISGIICGIKVLIRTEHNIEIRKGFLNITRSILRDFFGIFQKNIIAVSNNVKISHEKNKIFSKKKHIVLYNGVPEHKISEYPTISSYREEFGIKNYHHVTIGIIGSLTIQKGHEVFFEALDIIRCNGYNFKAVIVGDGPRRNELSLIVKNLGLNNFVCFTGVRQDVGNIINCLDILCLSSHWEGFPMVILEAMAAKKPVISTNVGGVNEALLHKKTGLLVLENAPDQISEAIIYLINNPDIRERMGHQGYLHYKKNFTLKQQLDRTEDLYCNLLKNTV